MLVELTCLHGQVICMCLAARTMKPRIRILLNDGKGYIGSPGKWRATGVALHYCDARHVVVPGHPFVDGKRFLGPHFRAADILNPRRSTDAE
jgi:hypothetical protein